MSTAVWVVLVVSIVLAAGGAWVISRNRARRELAKYELRDRTDLEQERTEEEQQAEEVVQEVIDRAESVLEGINTRHDQRVVDLKNVDSFDKFQFRR